MNVNCSGFGKVEIQMAPAISNMAGAIWISFILDIFDVVVQLAWENNAACSCR